MKEQKETGGVPRLRWSILTLFTEMFDSVLSVSLLGRAREEGIIAVELINFRDFAKGKHKVVDDKPFGGGAGMLLKVEPLAAALDHLRSKDPQVWVVLLTPQGKIFHQADAVRFSRMQHVALVCGRYEGFDERVRDLVDEEISLGDFVLAGGEAAAWAIIEASSRLVPGVVGDPQSLQSESFASGLLEYPQYTRPRRFRGKEVPTVLLEGNHAEIARWRREQSILRTAQRRPDLLEKADLTPQERAWLEKQKI